MPWCHLLCGICTNAYWVLLAQPQLNALEIGFRSHFRTAQNGSCPVSVGRLAAVGRGRCGPIQNLMLVLVVRIDETTHKELQWSSFLPVPTSVVICSMSIVTRGFTTIGLRVGQTVIAVAGDAWVWSTHDLLQNDNLRAGCCKSVSS